MLHYFKVPFFLNTKIPVQLKPEVQHISEQAKILRRAQLNSSLKNAGYSLTLNTKEEAQHSAVNKLETRLL